MREFFRGWRRKLGCLTLVVAVAFMGLWVRSLAVLDSISIPVTQKTASGVASGVGSIAVVWITDLSELGLNDIDWQNVELSADDVNVYDAAEEMGVKYCWVCCGFGIAKSSEMSKTVVILPYWSIVIPLTAISAFLFLKNPKTLAHKKNSEPVPNEGGATT